MLLLMGGCVRVCIARNSHECDILDITIERKNEFLFMYWKNRIHAHFCYSTSTGMNFSIGGIFHFVSVGFYAKISFDFYAL